MPDKLPAQGILRADTYKLMARCIEDGVAYGWSRAHKHVEDPEPESIRAAIEQAVIQEVCEWFSFGEH